MKMQITGFSHSAGISAKNRKPYEMARLSRLTEIRAWKNDNGESRVAGFETNERHTLEVYTGELKLINDLLLVSYPTELDLTFEPHPDDPTKNIVTGFKVVDSKADKF